MPRPEFPRVVITGACADVGRACAQAFSRRRATLLLCDADGAALAKLSSSLHATGICCDVGCSDSIMRLAERVSAQHPRVDVLINAGGAGYERTLAMHRVSRALMPALRSGGMPAWIFNVPPSETGSTSDIFPYASSREAFGRLSEALAQEVHGSNVSVGIACPRLGKVEYAFALSNLVGPARPEARRGDVQLLAKRLVELVLPAHCPKSY